jgi:predicted metal-binding protein
MKRYFELLEKKGVELGAFATRLIETDQIVFDPRSFLKCRFGCKRFGKYWTCPPHLGISRELFMEAFSRFRWGLVIQTADPRVGQEVALAVEKEAMLSYGCMYAMALVLCVKCDECAFPDPCKFPHLARPSMDAYGMDIGKTIAPLGFKVEFDSQGKLLPAWYGMVLLD